MDRLTGITTSGAKASAEATPYGGVVLDVAPALSLYASYAEIFQPQTAATVTGEVLPPRVGRQIETGVKGEFFDKRLNMHAAVFRLEDTNRALADPDNFGFSIAAGEVRSQGFETEISGEIMPRWRIAAGYAYTTTKFITGTTTQTGQPFATTTPEHNFNLWTHYLFPENVLSGWEVAGGVRVASEFYTQSGTVRFEGDAYAVASFAIGYRVSENFKASLNIENLFDEKYYERVQGATCCNIYGAPRSVMLTLRGEL